jgi:hypothetical protein
MPCPVAITWTFVMSPTISNTGYEIRCDGVSAYREGHHASQPGELRLPAPATQRRTGPRRCPRPPGRDIRGESRPACGRQEADDRAHGHAHAADARLSAHNGGVTSYACQLRHGCPLPWRTVLLSTNSCAWPSGARRREAVQPAQPRDHAANGEFNSSKRREETVRPCQKTAAEVPAYPFAAFGKLDTA